MATLADSSLLKKATADNTQPTYGPQLTEIAKITMDSQKRSNGVIEFLMERLKKDKPATLTKTLKVIKYCCENGHPDFKKEMQRKIETLRSAANFRGKPDPVHGDLLNQTVREAAQAAIEAVFSSKENVKLTNRLDSASANAADKEVQSKEKFTTGNVVPSGNSNSFANPAFAGNKLAAHFAGAASPKKNALSSFVESASNTVATGLGLKNPTENAKERIISQMFHEQHKSTDYIAPAAQIDDPIPLSTFQPPPSASHPHEPATAAKPAWGLPEASNAAVAEVDEQTEEQQLVESITLSQGPPAPSRTELTKFTSAAAQLDGAEISQLLDVKLNMKNNFQTRLRALCCIEALVTAGNQESIEYFSENPEDVLRNVDVVQASVKERAKKVLRALGLENASPRPVKSGGASGFGFVGDVSGAGGGQWNQKPPSSAEQEYLDRKKEFEAAGKVGAKGEKKKRKPMTTKGPSQAAADSDDDSSSPPAATTSPAPQRMSGLMNMPVTSPVNAGAPSKLLSMGMPQAQPAAAPSGGDGLDDLFGGGGASSAAATAPSSAFSFLSAAPSEPVVEPAATPVSGFGFLNSEPVSSPAPVAAVPKGSSMSGPPPLKDGQHDMEGFFSAAPQPSVPAVAAPTRSSDPLDDILGTPSVPVMPPMMPTPMAAQAPMGGGMNQQQLMAQMQTMMQMMQMSAGNPALQAQQQQMLAVMQQQMMSMAMGAMGGMGMPSVGAVAVPSPAPSSDPTAFDFVGMEMGKMKK